MALRAEERCALAVLLPQGLITGTLPTGSVAQAAPTPANGPKK
jgi:hypothetical protein